MKSVLKIWSLLMIVTLSFHLAKASEGSLEIISNNEALQSSELSQNIITIKTQLHALYQLQNSLSEIENTDGFMSALGQTIEISRMSLKNIQKTSDLEASRELIGNLSSLINQFKATNPLNQILGVHVNSELNF